jgi:hypothetical protein
VLATGVAGALPVIVSTVHGVVDGWAPYFDRAYIAASSYDVLSLHPPLIGRYTLSSGVTGHPTYSLGPLLYWLLAAPVRLASPVALAVWMGLTNVLAVIGVVGLACRRGGRPLMFATAAGVALMCGSLPSESLHDVENYYAYLLPFTLLLFLCWSLACGDYKLLPLTILVASFVMQCHLAVVLPTVGVLAVGLVGLAVSRGVFGGPLATLRKPAAERGGSVRRWVLAALAVGLICWSAPLFDQAIHRPGNLVRVARTAFSRGPTLGLRVGEHALVRAIGIPPWWLRAPVSQQHQIQEIDLRPIVATGFQPSALAVGSALLVLAGLLAFGVSGIRRRRTDVAAVAAIGLVLCVALVLDTASTPTSHGLYLTASYTLLWAAPAGMWVWLMLGWSLATLWRRFPLAGMRVPTSASMIALAAVVILGTVVASRGRPDQDRADYRPARMLGSRLDAALPRRGTVRVDGSIDELDPAGVAIYALRRRGHHVVTPFEYYLGQPYYAVGSRRYDYLLDIQSGNPRPVPGGRVIARIKWPFLMKTFTVTLAPAHAQPTGAP